MHELPKAYEPKKYEDGVYKRWEEAGFFSPEKSASRTAKNYFSLVLPPPNVTGTLHMGHAAMLAIEDAMVRFHRMKGDQTLWVPGTDHAAIATQSKVEKIILEKEKMTKYDLGREEFLKRVQSFAQESHDTIIDQCKKMGASLDWSREAYTLDEVRSRAVRLTFKQMYDDGLIYQGHRIVNWDPSGQTTVSDDEIVYKEEKTTFYYFQYGPFVIGTARPETKFGDKYVVVHPDDERYQDFTSGQTISLEWINGPITATVIKDEAIDKNFGTGAMTITPWHSTIDFEIAERHQLDKEQIIDEQGNLLPIAGEFARQDIRSARARIVEKLRAKGLLVKEEEYVHQVATAERSGGIIEPQIKKQWFIAVNKLFKLQYSTLKDFKAGDEVTLKKLLQAVVRSGEIKIIPDRFEKTYFSWIDNLRDWCISRQIWFGHQVPVWYKAIPRLLDMPELKKSCVEKQQGDEGSPVAAVKGQEYRFVVTLADRSWIEEHVTWVSEYVYTDFFNGKERIRIRDAAYVVTEKPTEHPGVVMKHVKKGICEGRNVFVEERCTAGFARYEIEFKDFLPEYFKNRETISSTDILRFQRNDRLDVSLYVDSSAPWFKEGWAQDPDTLDTWFSSGLWTFSTLLNKDILPGESLREWVTRSPDIQNFHPTSMLETGYDIIFFWVARMILMTTYALGDVPFKTVYLHGLVRDEEGRKMSKSLGNIINPLDMIEKYGTDATRLSLLLGSAPGNDTKLSSEKVAGFRNFTNKVWNIARFMLLSIEHPSRQAVGKPISLSDMWIVTRLERTRREVTQALEQHQFSVAGERLRDFTWNELADWYLEIAKIEGGKGPILNMILNTLLALWHPFMPFVTETIWQEMYGSHATLMIEPWPDAHSADEAKAHHEYNEDPSRGLTIVETDFLVVQEIITALRTLRAEYRIEPIKKLSASITSAKNNSNLVVNNATIIKHLARLEHLATDAPSSSGISRIVGEYELRLDISSAVDSAKEKIRLVKEIADLERYVGSLDQKLSNKQFVSNAPPTIIELERKKLAEAEEKLRTLREQYHVLES